MATMALIPVNEYLRSHFEPDAEYVDGKIEQRPMGEYDHSTWQQAIEQWFLQHARDWRIRVRCELRVQVNTSRYRVPDVVVFDRDRPVEQILTHPPIAVFEVLSPEDTTTRLLEKLDDYERMGIAGIFVLDPKHERAYRYEAGSLRLSESAVGVENSSVSIDWKAISALRD